MRFPLFILLVLTAFSSSAQNPPTLSEQYADVVLKSGLYNGHRAIRQERIEGFWKSVQDSLALERQKAVEARIEMASREKALARDQAQIDSAKQESALLTRRADQVSLLGLVYLSSSTYHLILWGLVGLLAISIAIILGRARSAMAEARHRTQLYDELNEEFRVHKSKANEKEIRLARELQTERNKVDELMGR